MKKIITLLLALVMCFACVSLTACSEEDDNKKTLYVYTNAGFAPYEYINDDGKVVGVDVEIMKEIGEILGYKIVVKDIDFNQVLVEVQNNKNAIGAAGITQRDDRDEVALASIPYATSVQYVIAPKDSLDSAVVDGKVSLSSLAGKNIGVQMGTTGHYMVDDAINVDEADLNGTGAQVKLYKNAILASNDIGSMVDVVVIDKLPAENIVDANSNLECYQLDAEPESYVIYFNKQATDLVAKVNEILEVMIENGVINYFTLKHSGGIV